jgi:hypothetical protein
MPKRSFPIGRCAATALHATGCELNGSCMRHLR